MARPSSLSIVAGLLGALAVAGPSAAAVIDLRDCRLDTMIFLDPWAGATFTVRRVGTNYSYLCEDGLVKEPPAGQSCEGPYGDLVLQGDMLEWEGEKTVELFAVWTVIKAAPCCGWTIADDAGKLAGGIEWLDHGNVPKLGELPFAGIDPEENGERSAETPFGNPKYAIGCTLD